MTGLTILLPEPACGSLADGLQRFRPDPARRAGAECIRAHERGAGRVVDLQALFPLMAIWEKGKVEVGWWNTCWVCTPVGIGLLTVAAQ